MSGSIYHLQTAERFCRVGGYTINQYKALCGLRCLVVGGIRLQISKNYYPGKRPTWYDEDDGEIIHEFMDTIEYWNEVVRDKEKESAGWRDSYAICPFCLEHPLLPLLELQEAL